jgi:hypothetical protein
VVAVLVVGGEGLRIVDVRSEAVVFVDATMPESGVEVS